MKSENIAKRRREPADAHFRRFDKPGPARSDELSSCNFEVYRADEVRMTSTLFGGGDWHWRLSDGEGLMLLDTGGYASEGECLGAVAILRENAGFASVSGTR
jgi:uncharacterized protein YegP (UPF0339 family)